MPEQKVVTQQQRGELAPTSDHSPAQQGREVMAMLGQALEQGHSAETIERLLAMQERVMATQARQAYNVALHAVQAEVTPVIATGYNTHTKSKYAKFEAAWKQLRPLLDKNGFAVSFSQSDGPGGVIRVRALVSHVGGHTEEHHLDLPPDAGGARGTANKSGVQAVGSTLSYARRYLIFGIFGMVIGGEDDDGVGGQVEKISRDQAENIRALLDELPDGTEQRMLAWQQVDTIEAIPATQYGVVVANLERKRRGGS